MSSLSEMPALVMENIIKSLDFRSVLTLRQVCRDFLNFIDRLNDSKLPDSGFSKIGIRLNKDICLKIEDQDCRQHHFIYSESDNSRSYNGKTTTLENLNVMDVAVRDLELILKFQKSTLNCSNFDLNDFQHSKESPFSVELNNMFRKINRKIKTKDLVIISDSQFGFMSILPFSDPETLEFIDLHPTDHEMQIEMDEIVKTEQWRKAKKIHCIFYALNMTVEDICHLSGFGGTMPSISFRDLDFLRKTFITNSNFEYSEFAVRDFEKIEGISDTWGPAFHSEYWSYWYFRIKDSNEKILGLKSQENIYLFQNIELNDVPNGAAVQDYNKN
ncbi:hypothetical protein B9Z55_021276 [Caenorhabditis nigoni]|uniref:F-box domain-containing protein n=2 Tax=Caenorhabditis nigoni TaxID=1611254 RepID=A0A2G5TRV4_9PELO|nr:hypothetical protein B9Z55_021276 [Caenorhabditis nigoni]